MANLPIVKQVFAKKAFSDTINTTFTELNTPITPPVLPPLPSISEFFEYYQSLFYIIPKFGDTESHQYLALTSQEYIGSENVGNEVIDALLAELTELRQENVELNERFTQTALSSAQDALKALQK
jgi:hypothetical protein